MRNPPQHIRDAYDYIDFSDFPDAEDDCLIQVNMYGASDESKQSPYHMGSVMSVQYKALQESYPWLTDAIPYSDQCGDYRSTAATVFNHVMGRLTGLRVRLVLHSEVGEGNGKTNTCQGSKDFAIRKEACSRGSERAARSKTIGRATCSFSWSDRCAAL